jgi:hypothetical protein
MTDPISFDPYLGWVDTTDPDNIPTDVRTVNAADLLRYENLGIAAEDRINSLIDDVAAAALPTAWTAVTGKPSTFTPSTHTHVGTAVDLATTSVQGAMSAADKTKLDNAVSAGTASRLVIRDASGRAQFADPSASADAATKNYVDTADALIQHSEWTSSASITSDSGPGTLSRDSSMSTNDSFVSSPGADRITLAAGIYIISHYVSAGSDIPGGSYIQLRNDADTVTLLESTPAAAGTSWWLHLNIPNFRVTASTTYRFHYTNTGSAQTWASRTRITKLK